MKTPQAWQTAGAKKVEATSVTKVTARIDMSAEVAGAGLCPECRRPMDKAQVNNVECYVCHSDRIAIPCPDEVEATTGIAPGIADSATFGPSTAQGPV